MKQFKEHPIVEQAQTEIQQIKPWPLAKYQTTEQLEAEILEYVNKQTEAKQPLTITGLALALWIDRHTLLDYKEKDWFAPIVNKAKQFILNYTEQLLLQKDKFTPWQIFYLKNNYKNDYSDKVEVEHTGSISLVELNKRAMQLQDCEIIDWEEVAETDIAQAEAQAQAEDNA